MPRKGQWWQLVAATGRLALVTVLESQVHDHRNCTDDCYAAAREEDIKSAAQPGGGRMHPVACTCNALSIGSRT